MKKLTYNIEFAHIYVNESFTTEHYKASLLVKSKIDELVSAGNSVTTSVLIDDYNPSEKILDIPKYIQELKNLGTVPDFVVFESRLVSLASKMKENMYGKLKRQYHKYINKNGKYPCSFLVAVWHLARLGVFSPNQILSTRFGKRKDKSSFIADKIITILPHRYGSVEKRAIDILKTTPYYQDIKDRLEYVFF